ncbi:PiggyBac transposable element-derived protein [Trinorchestia longiramus]|nr:PiggyBac transposable element-derived protein [Trinorchestia longiramus]
MGDMFKLVYLQCSGRQRGEKLSAAPQSIMDARKFYGREVNEISDTDSEMDSSSESCSDESELEFVSTGSSSNSSNEEEPPEDSSENEETNGESADDTWIALCQPLIGQGSTIFADNFYTSVPLAEKLLKEKTYYCGTLRKNRKFVPKSLLNAKATGIKVYHWKDKRSVLCLSTIPKHTDTLVPSGKKNRNGVEILKPGCVIDYNAAKKGVDISDQMTSYSTSLRRSTKWYRKVAIELLTGTSVVNAWVLSKKYYSRSSVSITEFREQIAMFLVTGSNSESVKSGRRSQIIDGKRGQRTLIEPTTTKTRKRCHECYKMLAANERSAVARVKTHRVKTYCDDCEGKPYLCVNCFAITHAK